MSPIKGSIVVYVGIEKDFVNNTYIDGEFRVGYLDLERYHAVVALRIWPLR